MNRLDRFKLSAEEALGQLSSELGLACPSGGESSGTIMSAPWESKPADGRSTYEALAGSTGARLKDSADLVDESASQSQSAQPSRSSQEKEQDDFFCVMAPGGHLDRAGALQLVERIRPVARIAAMSQAGRPAVVDLADVESISMDVVVLLAGFQCMLQRQGQSFVVIHARPDVARFFKASLRQSPDGAEPADARRSGDALAWSRTEYGWLGEVESGTDMPTRGWSRFRSRTRAAGYAIQRLLGRLGIHVGFR